MFHLAIMWWHDSSARGAKLALLAAVRHKPDATWCMRQNIWFPHTWTPWFKATDVFAHEYVRNKAWSVGDAVWLFAIMFGDPTRFCLESDGACMWICARKKACDQQPAPDDGNTIPTESDHDGGDDGDHTYFQESQPPHDGTKKKRKRKLVTTRDGKKKG